MQQKNEIILVGLPVSGFFLLSFLALGFLAAGFGAMTAGNETAAPSFEAGIDGTWASRYEKAFDEAFILRHPSMNGWGAAEYALFSTGRDGVLPGENGWLFTKEEFEYQPGHTQTIETNLSYILDVAGFFEEQGIALTVALLPAKARVYEENLGEVAYPSYKRPLYVEIRTALRSKGIAAPDLTNFMRHKKKSTQMFLRTDTHWSPEGAQKTAVYTAEYIAKTLPDLNLPEMAFVTEYAEKKEHEGDLLRYVPLGPWQKSLGVFPDDLSVTETVEAENTEGDTALAADALFGDAAIPVTLVGTSYSANALWNFDGFLKEALNADVLNAADEGLGPFLTMEQYLSDSAFTDTPPQLIVWEIPERYLSFSYDLKPLESVVAAH